MADIMTREQVLINHIQEYLDSGMMQYEACYLNKDDLKVIIKALEQEYIIDKIRTEIKALSNANPSYWHCGDMVEREEVFDIIDKYKAESEDRK